MTTTNQCNHPSGCTTTASYLAGGYPTAEPVTRRCPAHAPDYRTHLPAPIQNADELAYTLKDGWAR